MLIMYQRMTETEIRDDIPRIVKQVRTWFERRVCRAQVRTDDQL